MTIGITLLYVLTLASFVPPLILAGYLWFHGQVPLAANYLRFQLVYLVFLGTLFAAFLALSLAPGQKWAVEVFFNTAFYLLYALLLWRLARFLFEMLQRPWEGTLRRVIEVLALTGVVLPLGINAVVFDGVERALALRVVLNGGYFVVFLVATVLFFVLAARHWRGLADDWKRRTLGGACLIFFCGVPLFVVDALWPVLQLQGWIPRGLNLQIAAVLAWNVFFTFRWFAFPLHDRPEAAGEPSPRMLQMLTGREREIAVLILQGRSNQEICDALGVRMGTTKNHVYNIFNKTGASSRKELCRMLTTP